MTSSSYLTVLAAITVGLIGIDWWQLHTGRTVRYRRVSDRKLRAVTHLRPGDVPTTALTGSAPHPLGVEPAPAPGWSPPGAGPQTQVASASHGESCPVRDRLPRGDLAQSSAAVGPPDPAAAGFQPHRGWGDAGTSSPEVGVPARGAA